VKQNKSIQILTENQSGPPKFWLILFNLGVFWEKRDGNANSADSPLRLEV
jgi:hypothetical protein